MTFDVFAFSNDNCMHGFLALLINKCLCWHNTSGYFAVFADQTWRHLDFSDPQFTARIENPGTALLKLAPYLLFTWSRHLYNRELKIETFSGRRQLQPDVTSSFVGYCACLCSTPCRRGPVDDVKLVCLALWRKREYLTFISIRFVAFSNQNFADHRS